MKVNEHEFEIYYPYGESHKSVIFGGGIARRLTDYYKCKECKIIIYTQPMKQIFEFETDKKYNLTCSEQIIKNIIT